MMIPDRQTVTFILASASPRRRQLLGLTGWGVIVRPVEVDEAPKPGELAEVMARRLALAKMRATVSIQDVNSVILAADTIVADGDQSLGKPVNTSEAEAMLMNLRGRNHCVYTAIVLTDVSSNREEIDVCKTIVPMRDYSQGEVETYILSGEPMDKAGSYGIQDNGFRPVEVGMLKDCYTNVIGLPLCHVVRAMRSFGHPPTVDVPAACQIFTGFKCTVHPDILGH